DDDPEVPALAGTARLCGEDPGGGERASWETPVAAACRHDRGCDLDRGFALDQEPGQGARSRDAPDQERQPVVLRHEGAHRGGCRIGAGAHGERDRANAGDVTEVDKLLHGRETCVYADAGYTGAEKRVKPKRGRDWFIAAKRGKVKAIADRELRGLHEQIEHLKASVRAKVEHPFRVLKCQFGYRKVRYKGLA